MSGSGRPIVDISVTCAGSRAMHYCRMKAARSEAAPGRIFMTTCRLLALSLLAASALTATPAAAQRVDRIVAIGVSYCEHGKIFQLVGLVPIPAPF